MPGLIVKFGSGQFGYSVETSETGTMRCAQSAKALSDPRPRMPRPALRPPPCLWQERVRYDTTRFCPMKGFP